MTHARDPAGAEEDRVRSVALGAVARTRTRGLHFYGSVLGMTVSPPADSRKP